MVVILKGKKKKTHGNSLLIFSHVHFVVTIIAGRGYHCYFHSLRKLTKLYISVIESHDIKLENLTT